ncbi:MAG: hypothetical protein QOD14_293 [Solirubrobacterales bacterium]|nr:hypothetical protein [Solirubrobacterales bacterium]
MLKLRPGVVTGTDPLRVRVGAEDRKAWADEGLVGEVREGDEVIVNVEAQDLGLGSGGFDVVHANLTRGLDGPGAGEATAMKLNYTSLQHPVEPVEAGEDSVARRIPVLVLSLHGQLAPAAWAAGRSSSQMPVGYVQTWGGALPGSLSEDVAELRRAGLLCKHVTAGPAYGGELEALTVIGALQAAAGSLGWDAVIAGPGPGIAGSGSELGHGGMAALETAHASLILGLETLLAPRMSGADPRTRHSGLSHHSATVLRMLLGNVRVPAPARRPAPWPRIGAGDGSLDELREACGDRHEIWLREAPVDEYAASGLSAIHMGRELADDRLFYAAALSAGDALGAAALTESVR